MASGNLCSYLARAYSDLAYDCVGLASIFAIRGAVNYVLPIFNVEMEEPIARLNLILYGPLCLGIAAGLGVLL